MHIAQCYITRDAQNLIDHNTLAHQAFQEITDAVNSMTTVINNTKKNCNGVVPLKEPCYCTLEEIYNWYREKPLDVLTKKGGPIDVYKSFEDENSRFNVGIEFETGNISSAHRAMNKLSLGVHNGELHLAVLMMPMRTLSYYLTDRVSNYEELEPYFSLVANIPFIMIGFDVENYSLEATYLPKGKDGMSDRAVHKWKKTKTTKKKKTTT